MPSLALRNYNIVDLVNTSSLVPAEHGCPSCGQLLQLTPPLPSHARCPRCSQKFSVADLVSHSTPIAPIPASAPPSELPLTTNVEATEQPANVAAPPVEPPQAEQHGERTSVKSRLSFTAAGRGFHTAGSRILVLCIWFDRKVAGHRAAILGVALIACALSAISEWVALDATGPGWAGTVTGLVFLYLCWAMLVALAGSLQDADGSWRLGLLSDRALAMARFVVDQMRPAEFLGLPGYLKARSISRAFFGVALALLGFGNVFGLLGAVWSTTLTRIAGVLSGYGALSLVFSALAWLIYRGNRPKLRTRQDLVLPHGQHGLPAIIDLGAKDLRFATTDVLGEVLDAMSKWRPRRWATELEYEFALVRHLEKSLPTLPLERQGWVGEKRGMGVADIVVADTLLLELKRQFSRKDLIDRAVGQMQSYAVHAPEKVLLLVVFEAPAEHLFHAPATPRLEQLAKNHGVVTVRMPVPRGV